MSINSRVKLPKEQAITALKKLLGSLELEVMEYMWQTEEATVQQVRKAINHKRPIAYTTVMTVMGRLVGKGLLTRAREGKRYRYRVGRSKDEFLRQTSSNMVHTLVDNFGDLAIKGFLKEINKIDADRLEQLMNLAQEATHDSNISEQDFQSADR